MLINNLLFFSSKSSKQKLCYFVKKVVLKYIRSSFNSPSKIETIYRLLISSLSINSDSKRLKFKLELVEKNSILVVF